MEIAEVERNYIDNLDRLDDAGSQCDYLMMLGLQDRVREDVKKDCYRIGGCKTAIWIKTEIKDGKVCFIGDSDSLLVRGILAILSTLYNERLPQEVGNHPPSFLNYISDEVIYPEIKQNGILKCYKRLAALSIN